MLVNDLAESRLGFVLLLSTAFLGGCGKSSASASSPPYSSADAGREPRVFHYDLVLWDAEGSPTTRTSFSLDVSEAAPGSVSLAKNVGIGGGNRADVGTTVTGRLTIEGDTPRLEIDAIISSVDGAGRVVRVTAHGAAVTPLGVATVVIDTVQDGKAYHLSATPTARPALGAKETDFARAPHAVDVKVTQTAGGAPTKTAALTLAIAGDTPAVATTRETVPLTSVSGRVAVARQDVGTRVKATAHPRAGGLDVDFDLELSAVEAGGAIALVRKIHAHGPLLVPFDQETTAFVGEEDGHRYEVTLTPRSSRR